MLLQTTQVVAADMIPVALLPQVCRRPTAYLSSSSVQPSYRYTLTAYACSSVHCIGSLCTRDGAHIHRASQHTLAVTATVALYIQHCVSPQLDDACVVHREC
jgi:hypothetical protein